MWVPRFPGLGLLSHLTGLTLLSLFFHLGSLTGLELTKQAWLAGQVGSSPPLQRWDAPPGLLIYCQDLFLIIYWGGLCRSEGAHGSPEEELDPLELQLQVVCEPPDESA